MTSNCLYYALPNVLPISTILFAFFFIFADKKIRIELNYLYRKIISKVKKDNIKVVIPPVKPVDNELKVEEEQQRQLKEKYDLKIKEEQQRQLKEKYDLKIKEEQQRQQIIRENKSPRPKPLKVSPIDLESLNGTDTKLYKKLKFVRLKLSKNENIKVYLIFTNLTLCELAHYKPQNVDEMLKINGIGKIKAEKYGRSFLDEINKFKDS